MIRAVLDVNVLISALLSPNGAPAAIVTAWRAGSFELIASPALLDELEDVITRPRIATRLDDAASDLVDVLRADAIVHADPPAEGTVHGDPRDDYLVALARSAAALVIVTGDSHLLELEGLRPPAVEPAAFTVLLERLL